MELWRGILGSGRRQKLGIRKRSVLLITSATVTESKGAKKGADDKGGFVKVTTELKDKVDFTVCSFDLSNGIRNSPALSTLLTDEEAEKLSFHGSSNYEVHLAGRFVDGDDGGAKAKTTEKDRSNDGEPNAKVPKTSTDSSPKKPCAAIPLMASGPCLNRINQSGSELDELMKKPLMSNIERDKAEVILNESKFKVNAVNWNDIAGLDDAKTIIREIIVWPMQRPDIFTGLRGPSKGLLLFGPPGTGKTMIGRLIASQSGYTFFNISASTLKQRYFGEGERMVRALFAVARVKQPSVIFIDEVDTILAQRNQRDVGSASILNEFLAQFDGCGTDPEERILVIGTTNRPHVLDDAARRRLVQRIYIPLPDIKGRKALIKNLMNTQKSDLSNEDYDKVAEMTNGFSGADMTILCQQASYGPIRDIGDNILTIEASQVRSIMLKDFVAASKQVKASVDPNALKQYEEWDQKFGSRHYSGSN